MKTLDAELERALQEIGSIEPVWSEEDGMFIFEHASYPRVLGGDPDGEKAVESYRRALSGFIEERLAGTLSSEAERVTKGHGGRRAGAGRKGYSNSVVVRLPAELAGWMKQKGNIEKVMNFMQSDTLHQG